jgi:hypothetical protein
MKILFLDESGDHSLSVIDPQYPVFVLGGVIVDADYAASEMHTAVHRFKLEVLGQSDVTLRTAGIVRQQGSFATLVDPRRRRAFRDGLIALMRRIDYTVIACAIRKDAHLAAYGAAALDPYTLSLNVLVERCCFAPADALETQPGVIVAERRDQALDSALLASWRHPRERGTAYLRPMAIRDRIAHLWLEGKGAGIAGLELADLVVSPSAASWPASSRARTGRSWSPSCGAGRLTTSAPVWSCCPKRKAGDRYAVPDQGQCRLEPATCQSAGG